VVLTPCSPLPTTPTLCFPFCATVLCVLFCTVLNPDSSTLNILSGVNPHFVRYCFQIDEKITLPLLKNFALASEVACGYGTDS
jgi:hypothetical protein